MNTFPALNQNEGTALVPRPGVIIRYATNGAVRTRAMQSVVKYDPTVIFNALSLTDYNTFLTFYNANFSVPFTYVHQPDNSSHTCVFANASPTTPSNVSGAATVPFVHKYLAGGFLVQLQVNLIEI